MARKNQVEIVVNSRTEGEENLEKVARSLDEIAAKGGESSQKAAELAAELRELGQNQSTVAGFVDLKKSTELLKSELEEARNKAAILGQEFSSTEKPTRKLARELEVAKQAVNSLDSQLQKQTINLQNTRQSLQQAGISTKDLANESRGLSNQLTGLQEASNQFLQTSKRNEEILNELSNTAQTADATFNRLTQSEKSLAGENSKLTKNIDALVDKLHSFVEAGGEGAKEASRLSQELQSIGNAQQAVNGISRLEASTNELKVELNEARTKLSLLGAEISKTQNPSNQLKQGFDNARDSVNRLDSQLQKQNAVLQNTRASLQQAGISSNNLAQGKRVLASSTKTATAAVKKFTDEQQKANGAQNSSFGFLSKIRGGYLAVVAVAGALIKKTYDVALQFDSMNKSLRVVTGSTREAAIQMQFIKDSAKILGISVAESSKSYIAFMAATKGTALQGAETQRIYISVARAMASLGKSTEDTAGVMLALQQMVSKGKVQAEELRGQLGERLPGAFNLAAKSMSMTTQQLDKMLENGDVLAEDLLPRLRIELDKEYGGAGLDGASNEIARMNNELTLLMSEAGQVALPYIVGAMKGFVFVIKLCSAGLERFVDGLKDIKNAVADFDLSKPIDSFNNLTTAIFSTRKETQDKFVAAVKEANESTLGLGVASKTAAEELKQLAKDQGYSEEQAGKLTKAHLDFGSAQSNVRIELAKTNSEMVESNKSAERQNNLNIQAEKTKLSLAKAQGDSNAVAQATLNLSNLEVESEKIRLETAVNALAYQEKKLQTYQAEINSIGVLSASKEEEYYKTTRTVEALKNEVEAHKLNVEAAKANADESVKAATVIEQAFKRLNLISQAKQIEEMGKAKKAYEDIADAASKGTASQEDAKQAFMAYAKMVVEQSKNAASAQVKAKNDVAVASLRAKAETMGLGAEFAKLEGVATQAGDVASASVDKIAEASKKAAEGVAGIGSFLEENMVRGTTEVTKLVPVIVARAAAQINTLGEKARDEFVKMHGDLNGLIEKGTAADDIEAMTKRINQLGAEMSTLTHYSVRTGDHIGSIAAAAKGAEIAVLEQKRALAQMTEQMQRTNGESQKLPISLEAIASRFDKLDDADLSNLKSEIQRINGELEETKNAAKEATEQLEDMINAAKDDLDRDAGNIEAIEKRKLAKDLAKVDEQTKNGGDKAKAEELKSLLKHASDKRIIEERERQKAEKAREKEQAEQKRQQALAEKEQQSESKKQQSSSSESGSTAHNSRSSPTSAPQSSEPNQEVVRVVRFELPDVGGAVHLSENEAALFERWEKRFIDKVNRQSRIST